MEKIDTQEINIWHTFPVVILDMQTVLSEEPVAIRLPEFEKA